ncbi:hypothetical protein CABS01_16742 [Colletotrichum abscissum]|uniref:uncharacterized protein n=1 Tax=Colletotrichum abscissum TaxID=1671311 RepID=UPI0027D68998|nr:uncharacterized protein CABS01_16742 [Colletotrichum abscissum]KAK1514262.1 hypothetical protein CABS01_16742 [Colletotrichum abscissum]
MFAHNGMMCFVTSYHKGYRSSGQTKKIHRDLLREAGELLVWYLLLVFPFWREADGISKQAYHYSVFFDSDGQTDADADADAGEDVDDSRATWTWKEDRTWTTDRARRIKQRHSVRLLGNKLYVSMWRHSAIAIANWILNEAFGRWNPGRIGDEDEDENDKLGDSPGVAAKQQHFRKVSGQWHRFLGIEAEDQASSWGGSGGLKRKVELYDGVRLVARLRRFARLRQTDVAGLLRQMTGNHTATSRGNQERVAQDIVNSHSPIVQIMGTGGGKSLSFMLPAFCSPDGVTIVITTLTALRTDLDARSSVIFVTPESVISKGFQDFVAGLGSRQALDRVVVDECHVILEGTRSFRPKLREVGAAIREFGVQVVCLSATLASANEYAFSGLMGMKFQFAWPGSRSRERGPEERRRDDIDEACCRVAEKWLADGEPGKTLIYAMSIARVERLSAALACPAFDSDIDTSQGKADRLAARQHGSGAAEGLVVATNVLGLGIDVPEVRLVIHADMPRQPRAEAVLAAAAGATRT